MWGGWAPWGSVAWGASAEADSTPSGVTTAPILRVVTWPSGITTAPIRREVVESRALAPVRRVVTIPSGITTAPIRRVLIGHGVTTAPIRRVVRAPGPVTSWDLAVTLGGVDISARLTGEWEIDAEQSAARVATLQMLPPSGPVNPLAWSGQAVTIDLVVGGVSGRLFTGRVDLPTWDPLTGLVQFRCTDDLQNRVAALDRAVLDLLLEGGVYSKSVHGDLDDGWDYAQAVMGTIPGSLDADAYGSPRVSLWAAGAVVETLTPSSVIDETIQVELPRRASIRNAVRITAEYRYLMLEDRRATIGWSAPGALSATMQAMGWEYPAASTVASAVSGAGWTVTRQEISPAPSRVSIDYQGEILYLDIDADRCASYVAWLAKRSSQTITEIHTMTVTAPGSIEANGEIGATLSSALASEWSADQWEGDFDAAPILIGGKMAWSPDAPRSAAAIAQPAGGGWGGTTIPAVGSVPGGPWWGGNTETTCDGTAQPVGVNDTFEAVTQALLSQAKVQILASHRLGRVHAEATIRPGWDVGQRLAISTPTLAAEGQIVRLVHRGEFSTARATTRVSIALSGAGAAGVITQTPLDPPDAPANTIPPHDWEAELPALHTYVGGLHDYSDTASGLLANPPETISMYKLVEGQQESVTIQNAYYTPNGLPVTGFRVTLPGVSSCTRNPAELRAERAYQITIPADPITLTAQ